MKQTLASFTLTPAPSWGNAPKVRVFADSQFTASTEEVHPEGNYAENYETITLVADGNGWEFPTTVFDTTDDSSDPNATYSAVVMNGTKLVYTIFERWAFKAGLGSTITYVDLETSNVTRVPLRDDTSYSKGQTDLRIASALAVGVPATVSALGRVKMDEAPADAASPIAVGSNSSLISKMYGVATVDLPAASLAGRLRRITDGLRGFVFDTGTRWINALMGNICIEEYSTLAAMIADIGSTERTVYIPNTYAVPASATIPENITLKFTGSGKFGVSSGQTLTIQGAIEAPRRQIFSGSGVVSFSGNSKVSEVYDSWWGTKGDGITDSTAALQAARTASETNLSTLRLGVGRYLLSGAGAQLLLVSAPNGLIGEGQRVSTLVVASSVGDVPAIRIKPPAISTTEASAVRSRGYRLQGFGIESEDGIELNTSYSGGHGILIDTTVTQSFLSDTTFEDIYIGPLGETESGHYGIFIEDDQVDGTFIARNLYFKDCNISNGTYLFYHGDSCAMENCIFQGENEGIFAYAPADTGATSLHLRNVNVTNKRGVKITGGYNFDAYKLFVEPFRLGSTGSDGAALSLSGSGAAALVGASLRSCIFGNAGSAVNIDGIRLLNCNNVSVDETNLFNIPSGKVAVRVGDNSVDIRISERVKMIGASSTFAGIAGTGIANVQFDNPAWISPDSATPISIGTSATAGVFTKKLQVSQTNPGMSSYIAGIFTRVTPTALDFGSIAAGDNSELTVTGGELTGILAGETVLCNPSGDIGADFDIGMCRSVVDGVKIKVRNHGSGSAAPTQVQWRVTVLQARP